MAEEGYWWRDCNVVSGFDIGKRTNPSHHSVFAIKDDFTRLDKKGLPTQVMVMIHQKFLDQWEYIRQIEYLKSCAEYFGINRSYVDNTRSEFDERGLPRVYIPVALGSTDGPKTKSKYGLATHFAKLVEQKRIELIDDDRFINQITCVTNDLQAADTPLGHGDSFISVSLAIGAFMDYFARDRRSGFSDLGDIQSLLGDKKVDLTSPSLPSDICKICKGRKFEELPNGHKRCLSCMTIW